MLTLARVGVHERAWGYPTPDPNDDFEIYSSNVIYEGEVILRMKPSHLAFNNLTPSHVAVGSVSIHPDSDPRLHQARSFILLSPHVLHRNG